MVRDRRASSSKSIRLPGSHCNPRIGPCSVFSLSSYCFWLHCFSFPDAETLSSRHLSIPKRKKYSKRMPLMSQAWPRATSRYRHSASPPTDAFHMSHPVRTTVATSPASPAPLQILLYTVPIWGGCLLLTFFMPITGIVTSVVAALCLLVLPFKARRGKCPACGTTKTFPFSGFGNACKSCGEELVLRRDEIHQLEPRPEKPRPGSGRH